jgi:hypothetical protein
VLEEGTNQPEKRSNELKQADWQELRVVRIDKGIAHVIKGLSNPPENAEKAESVMEGELAVERRSREKVGRRSFTAIE